MKALNDLDDSGEVSGIFQSSRADKRGNRPDTNDARNLKIVAAIATEVLHEDCGYPLDQATARLKRELDKYRADKLLSPYNSKTIGRWRSAKCLGFGEWHKLFREGLDTIRGQETKPERRKKLALSSIKRLLA